MKTSLIVLALFFSISSIAATVRITSFRYVRTGNDLNHPLAELCGIVENASAEVSFLKVLVDASTRNPGTYNTLAGKDGKFCVSVITFRGQADVSIFGETTVESASLTPIQ